MNKTDPAPDRPITIWGWPLIALRLSAMLAILFICIPLFYFAKLLTPHNPVPRWFLKCISAVAGIRLKTEGIRPVRGTFLIANHVSWIDILGIGAATGSAFIAHDGLAQIRALRWLCSLNGTVFIARHDRQSINIQIQQIRNALGETGALTIFAEGTTSDGNATLPFKSSLLSALEGPFPAEHIPVQPIWLDYGPEPHKIAWVGDEHGVRNAMRVLGKWRGTPLTLHFLPMLSPQDRANRKSMAIAARSAIEAEKYAKYGQ